MMVAIDLVITRKPGSLFTSDVLFVVGCCCYYGESAFGESMFVWCRYHTVTLLSGSECGSIVHWRIEKRRIKEESVVPPGSGPFFRHQKLKNTCSFGLSAAVLELYFLDELKGSAFEGRSSLI